MHIDAAAIFLCADCGVYTVCFYPAVNDVKLLLALVQAYFEIDRVICVKRNAAPLNIENTVGCRAAHRGINAATDVYTLLKPARACCVQTQVAPQCEYDIVTGVGVRQAIISKANINGRAKCQ